ncbi:PAS domain S-box protein [Aureimonas leprariae]|uniref:Blue-light-activated histidine kinase n=1 Tax=Plantimonas leprariae TaxID=2615207 RepID=A0A7V7PKF1_9HYPH|nr:PAS domain S-box protein [Aureimonas leprariae]KAB0676293.1 PAS domain S-box protein [Aureimonas leprariae]
MTGSASGMPFPRASGEMAERIRALDWAQTPLGPIEGWTDRVRAAVETMLASPMLATLAVGPERLFLYNDAAARHYGNRHPDVLGRPLAQAFAHEFAAVAPFYDRVFAGESLHVPAQPLDPSMSGTAEVFDAYLTPVRNADGDVIAAAMTGFAIGERLRAETALRASEEKYRTLFASIDEGFAVVEVILDGTGKPVDLLHLEANAAYERHTGLHGIVGKRSLEIIPEGGPWLDFYGQVALTGQAARNESYLAPPVDRWIAAYASRIGGEGSLKVAIVFNDVTEQKRAEATLRESEERQAFLLELGDTLRPLRDAIEIQNAAVRLMGERLAVSRAGYYEVEADQNEFFLTARWEREAVPLPDRMLLTDFGDEIRAGYRAGRTMVARDTERDAASDGNLAAVRAIRVRAWIGVPLVKDGRWVAAVGVHSSVPRDWTPAEIRLVEEVGERTWAAAERACAEAALRDNEERFRAFVTASSDVVYRMGPDWTEMRRLDGRGILSDTVEPSGNWLDRYIHPDDHSTVRAAIGKAIDTKSTFEQEHRVIRTDGSLGWTLSRAVPILDGDGGIVEWLGSASDVTERKLARQAQRESEALRRVALAGGGMGTWRWDLANRLVWGDAKFLALWGFPPSEEAHPLSLFTERMSPEGAAEMQVIVNRAIDAGEEFDGPLEIVAGPTAGRWIRWRGRGDGEAPTVLYGVTFDVTAQRRADAALRDSEARQAFLLELSDVLRPLADPTEIQGAAMRVLGGHLNASRVFYVVVDGDGDTADILSDYTDGVSSRVGRYSLSAFSTYAVGEWRAGRFASSDDVNVDPRYDEAERRAYASVSTRAGFGIPLIKQGRLVALLGVNQSSPRHWSDYDIDLAGEVAERTWAALERARAEAALGESERRFRTLAETAPAFIWFNDEAGANAFVNQAFLDYTGRSAEQIAGEGWHGLVHPDQEQPYVESYLEAVRTRAPWYGRNLIRRADGAWHWFDNYARPLFRGDGGYRGHVGVTIDVDDKVRAEEALRESEERYRTMFETMDEGYLLADVVFDGAGRAVDIAYVEANPAAIRMVGSDLTGHRLRDVADYEEYWYEIWGRVAVTGEAASLERYAAPDGIWYEFHVFKTEPENADSRRVAVLFKDVTRRRLAEEGLKQSEERLRGFGEASTDVLWIRDVETLGWTYLTPAFEAIYGLPRDEAFAGNNFRNWTDLIVPEDRQHAVDMIGRVRDGESVTFEYRVQRPSDGAIRWLRNTDFPIRDAQGRVTAIGGVGHDATEEKEAEEALRESEAQLQVMVAELHHRTRNLIGIVGMIMRQIVASSDSLADFRVRFTERLEALSRVQGLFSRKRDERIHIGDIVRIELDALGADLEGDRVAIEGEAIALRKSAVQTLSLAVHELATNARKYGALRGDEGRLAVRWEEYADEGGKRRMRFAWTETGISVTVGETRGPLHEGGYGRTLIEEALPYTLKAKTTYTLGADRLDCTIDMPLDA